MNEEITMQSTSPVFFPPFAGLSLLAAPGSAQVTGADYARGDSFAARAPGLVVDVAEAPRASTTSRCRRPAATTTAWTRSGGGECGVRKRNDFFVEHLLGVELPSWSRATVATASGSR